MSSNKIVIIGGVAAGMSTAAKARRVDKNAEIQVFDKDRFISYGACGLPYYISGVVKDYIDLIVRTPEFFKKNLNIDVSTNHEVLNVDFEGKMLTVKNNLKDKTFEKSFDKLVIASGATPIMPDIPGNRLKNVFTLRNIDDGIRIKEAIEDNRVENVVIIGAGYIGMELVESMVEMGKKVTLLNRSANLMKTYDEEIKELILEEFYKHKVNVAIGEKILNIQGKDSVEGVQTEGKIHKADAVIIAVGVRPSTNFLKDTKLELFDNGAVIVDSYQNTNLKDVYSAGDCATVYHKILNKNAYIPLGTNANKQGKALGENLFGNKKPFPGALGTSVVKILDLNCGKTGLSEKEAQINSLDYKTNFVKTHNHSEYYPGNSNVYIKLVYDKHNRKLLGVQMAGKKGIALRINTFAATIDRNMTVDEIGDLDLSYAPPFSSAWDPIHVASNTAK